jgi:hypothetical protein
MGDDAIKKRMARAKRRAVEDLRSFGYQVVVSDNSPVCLMAYNESSVKIIRICLDKPLPVDRKSIGDLLASPLISRELWIRQAGEERFDKHKIESLSRG